MDLIKDRFHCLIVLGIEADQLIAANAKRTAVDERIGVVLDTNFVCVFDGRDFERWGRVSVVELKAGGKVDIDRIQLAPRVIEVDDVLAIGIGEIGLHPGGEEAGTEKQTLTGALAVTFDNEVIRNADGAAGVGRDGDFDIAYFKIGVTFFEIFANVSLTFGFILVKMPHTPGDAFVSPKQLADSALEVSLR